MFRAWASNTKQGAILVFPGPYWGPPNFKKPPAFSQSCLGLWSGDLEGCSMKLETGIAQAVLGCIVGLSRETQAPMQIGFVPRIW